VGNWDEMSVRAAKAKTARVLTKVGGGGSAMVISRTAGTV